MLFSLLMVLLLLLAGLMLFVILSFSDSHSYLTDVSFSSSNNMSSTYFNLKW